MSGNYIRKVAIVGASGRSGNFMVEALLKTGKHTVTAITRADSTGKVPDGVEIKKIDYNDQSSIVAALQGQDALIITMNAEAPRDQQTKLIDAAAEASVPWILPNEWGIDSTNDLLRHDLPMAESQKGIRDYIVKLGKSSYVSVVTGFWYEWSLGIAPAYGFDFDKREVTFFDDGDQPICTSTWPQVGRAVASLLSLKIHPDGAEDKSASLDMFKNDIAYISSFTVSQKDMLESVLRVTQTKESDWKITKESSFDRFANGAKAMKEGDRIGFIKMLYTRDFFPDEVGNYEKTRGLANELLGLPKENIDDFTKVAIERAKTNPFA